VPSASDYCPFDLSTDPSEFDLVPERMATRFGKMLVLRRAARGSDEATLLLHGVGARWTTWTPLLRAGAGLSTSDMTTSDMTTSDIVAVDLPGFGESENKLGHLQSLDVAAELGEVLARLGYTRARLVGHSMGGLLALDMAARPQALEISSLHLAAGSGFAILKAVNHAAMGMLTAPLPTSLFWTLYATGRTRASRSFVGLLHRRGLLPPLFWPVIAHPRRFPPRALAAIVNEMAPESFRHAAANLAGYDAGARWAAITQPVYAAFGAKDRFVDASDRRMLARVRPQATCTVIPDASHFLHIERPAEVITALRLG
jgi:pimeloyl-ACP methyl ester carboxylesterase